ncbi:MAG TPA: amidohydrolase family protein [Candidatus Acidoferrales bacterium]|jgi:L-fuconolactonase|nr:amidohydrolase family protein [Candidatus Acidoferrales bacterium]
MNGLPIVDSHVHLWNPAQFRYPWLDALPALNRAWLAADFAAASATTGVGKMIFIECGCKPALSLAEVIWASDLAKAEPRLKGIVAHATLEKSELVRADLTALSGWPLVKGVRRNLQGESDAGFLLRPEFVAGVKQLAGFGFTCDLCIRPEQLRAAAKLAARVPEVTFVLDHFGKPDVRGKHREPWAADLRALAALPNVACKLSGLTTEADWSHWRPDDLKFYFERALECFGFDRVLFGSDWPVATLATDYRRWVETVQESIQSASPADRIKVFQTNAERIYRV